MIKLIRIDDRLIHGQIVTKWIDYCHGRRIIVVDDKSATDFVLKSILSIAVPAGIQFDVVTKADFLGNVNSIQNPPQNTILIVKTPQDMLNLVHNGYLIGDIPVVLGNIGFDDAKKDVVGLLDYLYVDPFDAKVLRELADKVENFKVQAVPDEREKNIVTLLDKKGY